MLLDEHGVRVLRTVIVSLQLVSSLHYQPANGLLVEGYEVVGLYPAGFCPHWSVVVGSNHHPASLTTTQLMFNSTSSIFNMGDSPFS